MLVLTRRKKQKVLFPTLNVSIEIIDCGGKSIRLGIEAPEEIIVVRGELVGPDGSGGSDGGDQTSKNDSDQSKQPVLESECSGAKKPVKDFEASRPETKDRQPAAIKRGLSPEKTYREVIYAKQQDRLIAGQRTGKKSKSNARRSSDPECAPNDLSSEGASVSLGEDRSYGVEAAMLAIHLAQNQLRQGRTEFAERALHDALNCLRDVRGALCRPRSRPENPQDFSGFIVNESNCSYRVGTIRRLSEKTILADPKSSRPNSSDLNLSGQNKVPNLPDEAPSKNVTIEPIQCGVADAAA